jgi:class 3 adenylate cyclase/tetratricopeptide (TPR) repeat protein
MMTQCHQCGRENPAQAKFCGQCGGKLDLACGECGAANPVGNKFCSQCGHPLASDAKTKPGLPAPGYLAQVPPEERRWATLLFADVAGFTALSERLDPEDVKALAGRCADQLSAEVHRFGGTVITIAGDQVVAAFGAPVAHEDDAERAVRAALAMRACVLGPDPDHPLRVHIGVNTGDVMAGLIGPQERKDYAVMGDTTNVAARLMSAAPGGSVLVGEETWRATRRSVRYRELPPLALKGKAQPVPVWEALEATSIAESRPLGSAPLVGRDEELALLSDFWLKVVREARPHLVTVLGEPGIGKSRLVGEFEKRFCTQALVLHGRCLPYGETFGYGALTMALKEAAGLTAEVSGERARGRLTELVQSAMAGQADESDPEQIAGHLALLSGMDVASDRSDKPADQRVLHGSLRKFLEAFGRQKPLCLILEDLHWADDCMLDLIEYVTSRAKDVPLLIIGQARPSLLEKRPGWGRGVQTYTALSIGPLHEVNGRELLLALCRQHGLGDSVADQIGRGAGGNPLFAEELVAMVAERGADAGIPSALKALISARLDSLPAAERRTLQLAAILGKVFWAGGLVALGADAAADSHLEALEQSDLLRVQLRSQLRSQREFAFKHDLIRDVAYEILPRAERRRLHGLAADWIERTAGTEVDGWLDQLAHHALKAEQEERALDYLVRASARANRAAAYRQEAALLARAVAIAEHCGQRQLIGQLRGRRGQAFIKIAAWAEAITEFEAALDHLPVEESGPRAEALVGIVWSALWSFNHQKATEFGGQALSVAEQAGRPDLVADALGCLAMAEMSDGGFERARQLQQRAIQRIGGVKARSLSYASNTSYALGDYSEGIRLARDGVQAFRDLEDSNATIIAMSHLGLNLAAKGHYDEAVRAFDEARRFGQEREIWPLLARSISMSSSWHLELFDFLGAEKLAREAQELALSVQFRSAIVSTGIDLLFNLARREEVAQAEVVLNHVAEEAQRHGGWHTWIWKVRLLQARAELELSRGQANESLTWAAQALTESQTSGRVKYEGLALWVRGRALHALGRTREAIPSFRQAVDLARRIDNPAMFLQSAATLLAVDGDDDLLTEARSTASRILEALPGEETRNRFRQAEPVKRVLRT